MKAFLVSKPFGVVIVNGCKCVSWKKDAVEMMVDRKGSAVSSPRCYLYVGAFRFGLVTIAENSKKTKGDFHNDCKHRRCSLAFGAGFRPSASIPAFVPQVSQAWHFTPNVLLPSIQFNSCFLYPKVGFGGNDG